MIAHFYRDSVYTVLTEMRFKLTLLSMRKCGTCSTSHYNLIFSYILLSNCRKEQLFNAYDTVLLIFFWSLSRWRCKGILLSDFVSWSEGFNLVSIFQSWMTLVAMFSRTRLYEIATCLSFNSCLGFVAERSKDSLSLWMIMGLWLALQWIVIKASCLGPPLQQF